MSAHRILPELVGGALHRPQDAERVAVYNPATEAQTSWLPIADAARVAVAIESAADAFRDGRWSGLPAQVRADTLRQIADLLEANAELLAQTETADTGMPLSMTRQGHIPRSVSHLRFFAGECERQSGQCFELDEAYIHLVRREPLGVVAILAPWNAPLAVATINLAAALAAGNTVLIKSSERAPGSLALLAQILAASDLPAGAANIIHGPAEPTGVAMVRHTAVDGLCFVGGTNTARHILTTSNRPFRRNTFELGGKSPTIVLADANLDDAIDGALLSAFSSNGEVCTAGSRILVHRQLYDSFLERLIARTMALRVGDPLDTGTEMGPLIDEEHRRSVERHIGQAVDEGATLACGGERPARLATGFYLTPAVLTGVVPEHACFREEAFGPVVGVMPFADDDDGVRLANDTDYGLAATVWSADTARALALSRKLRCGSVGINTPLIRDIRAPFGGMKASGFGRVGGRWSIEQYTETKTTCMPVAGYPLPRLGLGGE